MTMPPDLSPPPEPTTPDATHARCIIVHPNVLVAEDLREILASAGAREVVAVRDIAQAPEGSARVVLVSGALDVLVQTPQVRGWTDHAVPVILLDSGHAAMGTAEAGFHTLEEPFRTEDVTALLARLEVF